MKTTKTTSIFLTALLAMGLTFNFFACSENSPLTPESQEASQQQDLNILVRGDALGSHSLKKSFETSAWVTPKRGGTLFIVLGPDDFVEHFEDRNDGEGDDDEEDDDGFKKANYGTEPGIMVKLRVRRRSVKKRTKLSLTLDDEYVDMQFGPEGLVFKRPALLNIVAIGLDLANANLETLDIYYDNPETGRWEKVRRKKVIVDKDIGLVKIVNARLPHFSRYAVAWSN